MLDFRNLITVHYLPGTAPLTQARMNPIQMTKILRTFASFFGRWVIVACLTFFLS